MSRSGFYISRLVITGRDVDPAEVTFTKGANVITGPSNSGKSYIVECIEYVFGADSPPGTDIEEARGYDVAYVELTSYSGESCTLERALGGGDVNLYKAAFSARTSVEAKALAVETQTRKRDTLSNFLLSLFDVKEIEVRSDASGSKNNLTFRMISHLFLVDESRIIAKASPVRLPNGYAKTASERAFSFLITGQDDHAIIPVQKPKARKAAAEGKKEAFDELIFKLDNRLKDVQLDELRKKASELDESIREKLEKLETNAGSIQEMQVTRQSTFQLVRVSHARLETIGELLARFAILKEHYVSDLKRLEFLRETDYFFDQLTAIRCPLCGTLLETHAAQKMCVDSVVGSAEMQVACAAEAVKIQALLHDLERTISTLESERATVTSTSQEQRSDLDRLDRSLADELRPGFLAIKKELDALSIEKQQFHAVEDQFQTLEQYRIARSNLDETDTEALPKFEGLNPAASRKLSNTIQRLLRDWRFIGDEGVVEFSETKMDLLVDGKARQSNGKGIRAFLHTSFNIGLMHLCREEGLPHPGTVVIDSPLTSYREGKTHEAEDEASPEIQSAFWDSLSRWTTEEQIILIENKEPTGVTRERMNYIHFVGKDSAESGRPGLFPLKTII
ncbi:MAG: AAA family ATPase [Alloacidobacterium sp.]